MKTKSTVLEAAFKIRELAESLENISKDDKRDINTYTEQEIRAEAAYVRSLYSEGGAMCREELDGEHGVEEQRIARKSVKALDKLIKQGDDLK